MSRATSGRIPPEKLGEEREIMRRLHEGKSYEKVETLRIARLRAVAPKP
ncbi:MAG: hypothetical protein HYZ74_04535 [Elusimicrobia bacterium]|nr:hypothetical protein [Elusimicrobiota bacterium]